MAVGECCVCARCMRVVKTLGAKGSSGGPSRDEVKSMCGSTASSTCSKICTATARMAA